MAEGGDVGGDEVGALRDVHLHAESVEAVAQEVASSREVVAELLVEGGLVVERVRDGGLEGRAGGVESQFLAPSTAATRSAGPVAQPIFQPVKEKVLPELEIVTVRSNMPGQGGDRHVLRGRRR